MPGAVGFIGLGDQGGPMAEAILDAGHDLHLWARRPEVLSPYAARGATTHLTIRSLCRSVTHLCLCVPDEEAVRNVLFGGGAIETLAPGSIVSMHATISPASCAGLAKALQAKRLRLVDAPVSGGRIGAAEKRLLVIAGGDRADIDEASAIYRSFASRIVRVGEAGAGQTAKILNNLLLNANLAASHFVLEYGRLLGLDREALRGLMLDATGASLALDWIDRIVVPGRHPATLGRKDIGLALALADLPPEPIRALADLALRGREAIEKGDCETQSGVPE